jgi:hypothetical protein
MRGGTNIMQVSGRSGNKTHEAERDLQDHYQRAVRKY